MEPRPHHAWRWIGDRRRAGRSSGPYNLSFVAILAVIFDLLLLFARAKCPFLIAGETGSGKTALLESIVNSWQGTLY
ncbi:MAG: hypothetical protein EI684_20420 [Candidatus Viridilinea halotolerans]|uniref:Uncharacterized protein n=1 Tax=Candidatus Viridilinea halotolerans TaxID=2491704 RepID=A0A426TS28_9CHLR|nr:MAG: hypothetical protein EI684_20420 [Candidatus Viridilinea halotolerans]